MIFPCNRVTCIGSGAGFISIGGSSTIIRMTFGIPFSKPGNVNKIAIRKDMDKCGVRASGGKAARMDVDIANVNVSTRV